MKSHLIADIKRGSPAYGRVHPGDLLLTVGGRGISDVLDYEYLSSDARVELRLKSPSGQERVLHIKKREGEPLGLVFDNYLMSKPRGCANKCVFCFIDQLPSGMRDTLYFKDDDSRLSFLTGSYITLTNLSRRELERIVSLRISPVNISVHATEPELRVRLLGNRRAGSCLEDMRYLAETGIKMNCQIVVCPGLNDGAELDRTMRELRGLWPSVASVSVVPVGLTRHREGLTPLRPVTNEGAKSVISQVDSFGGICQNELGSRLFCCADELYIKAGLPIPDEDYYADYPQLENGVGMLRLFESEFTSCMALLRAHTGAARVRLSVATGVSAAPFLEKLMMTAREKYANIDVAVYAVENEFFGKEVNVAGLITGFDLAKTLRGAEIGECLLIPSTMLRHGGDVFLDDMTTADLEREIGARVEVLPTDGAALADRLRRFACGTAVVRPRQRRGTI